MQATFPSPGLTRGLMLVGGLSALTASAGAVGAVSIGDPNGALWSIPFLAAYLAGMVAFRARPDSLAARRLLAFGAGAELWYAASLVLLFAADAAGREWWLGPANLVVQILGLAMGTLIVALLAVYPDGIYQRGYQRRLVRGFAALAVAVPVLLLLARPTLQPAWVFEWATETPGSPLAAFPDIASPLHIGALSVLDAPLRAYLEAALGLAPLAGAAVAAERYRHLRSGGRLQVRWPLYGILALFLVPSANAGQEFAGLSIAVTDAFAIVALLALPASVVVGLVKPDLFDIDRAMRRSLVYVPLWIAIAGAYVGVAALLGPAASGKGLQLAIGVTIVATVMFEPARRSLARRAGRWAYGESISGEEMVRRLGDTLEHTLDLEQLTAAIAAVAREGLMVRWAQIRLDDAGPVTEGEPPQPGETPALSAALVHAGEHLGEIECGPRGRGRMQASDRALFETLARQAALAIHNARLAGELGRSLDEIKAQAGELAASRSRIVAAQESARRQIERDIHDGSQQELVALIARIGLAQSQFGRDPGRLGETLAELQSEARQALENLRQFASGIHPAVLSDHGIVEAIESRAARFPLGVTIECDPRLRATRFEESVEGGAYFFVCEGFANALKHAAAERVRVRIRKEGRRLEVEVSDDGAGFDAAGTGRSGLAGLADRLEALGGSLDVDSAAGRGTRLTARLPIDEPAVV